MIFLLLSLALADPDALTAAREEAARFPDDYGTQVAWAEAAMAAADADQALQAWRAAQQLAGPTYEVCAGHVKAVALSGRHEDARREAASLTAAFPDVASAWTLRADLAWTGSWTALAALQADPWRVRAAELQPDATTTCAAATNALLLGDRIAARARATDLSACPALHADLQDRWSGWGALWAVGLGQTGTADTARTFVGGVAGVAQVGVTWDDLLSLDATVRSVQWSINPDLTDGWTLQQEGWLRLTAAHHGAGASVIAGGVWPAGTTTYTAPAWSVGGRAWGTAWATALVEGAYTSYSDGDAWQFGGGVSLPVLARLRVDPGLQYTRFTPDTGTAIDEWSGTLGLSWTDERWKVAAVGRFGAEIRPIRLAEPSVWNLTQGLGSSFDLQGSVRLRPGLWLQAGYGLAVLKGTTAPEGTTQQGVLGVVITDDISRR